MATLRPTMWPEVAASADPERTEVALQRILEASPAAAEHLEESPELREAAVRVVAASPFLSRVLATDPLALDVLSHPSQAVEPMEPLARWKALEVLRIASLDLSGAVDLEHVGAALAHLADGLVRLAGPPPGLVVVAMGKMGARELNYGSDIDLVLVGDADPLPMLYRLREAWRTDLALRPEGRAGALVRTLASYEAYWDRWAQTWEFQALLKARPVAGEPELARSFAVAAAKRVWGRHLGPEELHSLRAMKSRAEQLVARKGMDERELKVGTGGIRDIEFSVQLLQLVHGRDDAALRTPATLDALAALGDGGYIARGDGEVLDRAYRWFREAEHRLQLLEDRPVHALPAGNAARSHLARVMGYRDGPGADALTQFETDFARHRSATRSVQQRLYFRPLLEVFTTRTSGPPAMAPQAAAKRLATFGFSDAARTREAVIELTQGFSRSSRLMSQMVPLLLDWLSQAPSPDLGLLGLRRLATGAHRRGQLTALFRESPRAAAHLCSLLGTSSLFAEGFEHHPEQLAQLAAGPPAQPPKAELVHRATETIAWRAPEQWWRGLASLVRSETLRSQARDVLGLDSVAQTAKALTDVAEAVLEVSLRAVAARIGGGDGRLAGEVLTSRTGGGTLARAEGLALVAMGRFGGAELSYASDLDLMVVFDSEVHPPQQAERIAESMLVLLKGDTPVHRLYEVDLSLRPEGRGGPLARSLKAFEAYYSRWAQVWERQALVRGRFVAGDPVLGERFASLAADFVWGRELTDDDVREIRRMKARMERERVPAGEDAEFHLKLGPGSLSDVEWTVQLLQLRHGASAEGTLVALGALERDGVVSPEDAAALRASYEFCEATRNRLYLVRGGPSGSLPPPGPRLTTLARSLGMSAAQLREDYRRLTRRSRRVTERLFYGQ